MTVNSSTKSRTATGKRPYTRKTGAQIATRHTPGLILEGRGGEVWRLYAVMSWTQQEIGNHLGIQQSRVSQIIKEVRDGIPAYVRDEVIKEHVAQLTALKAAYMPAALKGNFESAKMVLRLLQREARLLGLDAPTRVITPDSVKDDVKYMISLEKEFAEAMA